jgi:hypothetical protein
MSGVLQVWHHSLVQLLAQEAVFVTYKLLDVERMLLLALQDTALATCRYQATFYDLF